MPGRNFYTIVRPGHYPDSLQRHKPKQLAGCVSSSTQQCLHYHNTESTESEQKHQARKHLLKSKRNQTHFRKTVKNGFKTIGEEPGYCGNCQLPFDRMRSHLRKCHPRLYRRIILTLRKTSTEPSSGGDVKTSHIKTKTSRQKRR
ncbi:uncharacterized protein LOC117293516 [Asterias rubens]|uniref:uncharacterized protein LOC117293516 n=1 Tax=Asterias rubens TaxID=7604 RepID=UPI001455260A|nr:uncharacterized protein LOC117293516 [Asterias rubens]